LALKKSSDRSLYQNIIYLFAIIDSDMRASRNNKKIILADSICVVAT